MPVFHDSRTKIIATIGPASNNPETLRKMIIEGLDVCRLNFSHGTHQDHEMTIGIIRQLNKELNTEVATLADLQGPKLRIGEVENNQILLNENDTIRFVSEPCLGTSEKIYMSYTRFPLDVMPGEIVLIDDGKIKLEVVSTNRKDTVTLRVVSGGILSSKKGVNLPNTKISLPSLTEKDLLDVEFALKHDIQWIALSFVRTVKDILDLKEITDKSGKMVRIIAKIEKPEAIENMDEILDYTDGVMVARGDLGVETPFDMVPVLQKQLVRKCIMKGKPVIIATQMMEGMITNFLPTRAEATDVSNAVLDGADAVMLSGETSVGKYPVEVIRNMQRIISATESSSFFLSHDHPPHKSSPFYISDSVSYHACKIADLIEAAGIIVFTYGGGTAMKIASYRPKARILAFTSDDLVKKQLSLVRGVDTFSIDQKIDIHDAMAYALEILRKERHIKKGDKLVAIAGIPMIRREPVNTINITEVSE
jgi:pyruvate kinase